MAKISGVYCNGFGEPVAGVVLVLTTRATSAGVITATTATQTTSATGGYSLSVMPGVYVVNASGAYLGVINVYADSPDGTLNEYLTNFNADGLTPAAVQQLQELVKEAEKAAAAATTAATEAKEAAEEAKEAAEEAGGDVVGVVTSVNGHKALGGNVQLSAPMVAKPVSTQPVVIEPGVNNFDRETYLLMPQKPDTNITIDLKSLIEKTTTLDAGFCARIQVYTFDPVEIKVKSESSKGIDYGVYGVDGKFQKPARPISISKSGFYFYDVIASPRPLIRQVSPPL